MCMCVCVCVCVCMCACVCMLSTVPKGTRNWSNFVCGYVFLRIARLEYLPPSLSEIADVDYMHYYYIFF